MDESVFSNLLKKFCWKPIPGCDGRYTLRGGISDLAPSQIAGPDHLCSEEHFPTAKDPVLFCYFSGGGLISYRKEKGYIHTLCNEYGMNKKMNELRG